MRRLPNGLWALAPPGLSRIGPYRVHCEIGRGGMGAVFLGSSDRPHRFHKLVAIKTVLPDRQAGSRFVDMFLDEARLASQLQHPNIVHIYDLGQDGELPYLVMEYVHGESLASVMAVHPSLPDRLAVSLAHQICDALAYAHGLHSRDGTSLGLVHRDLSPPNILISYDGVPKLVDFGIAHAQGRSTRTDTGVVKGRFAYMPPEQRLGQAVDGRSDLYALGMVLYQITTGKHPWEVPGEQPGIPARPPAPFGLRPDYPVALWNVVQRATAPDKSERFGSAEDMLLALRALAEVLGGSASRQDLEALLREPFAGQRALKEQLLGAESGSGEVTDVIAPDAAEAVALGAAKHTPVPRGTTPTPLPGGAAQPPAPDGPGPVSASSGSTRRRLVIGAGLLLAAGALIGAAALRGERRPPAVRAAVTDDRVCLIGSVAGSVAEQERTWALVRVVGEMFDRAPRVALIHGYRALDRFGWSEAGLAKTRDVCRTARASRVVVVQASADGVARVSIEHGTGDARTVVESLPAVAGDRSTATQAVRIARRLMAALGTPAWEPLTPELDDAALLRLLKVKEHFRLEREAPRGTRHFDAAIREAPALEETYVIEAIRKWTGSKLDTPDEQAGLRRPPAASPRANALLDSVLALADGRSHDAAELTLRLLEDRRNARDSMTLYLAGEARVHEGRTVEGALLLERALAEDPQLMPAVYHLLERRLAGGDWAGVDELADRWERADPSDSHARELRAYAALGSGRYQDAVDLFSSIIGDSGGDGAILSLPNIGLIYARLYLGDTAGALAHADLYSQAMSAGPSVAAAMPEPIAYAVALERGDPAAADHWAQRIRAKLDERTWTANHHQLAYVAAILDQLVGREGVRVRWLRDVGDEAVPRGYKFVPHAEVFSVLEAAARKDRGGLAKLAAEARTPEVRRLAGGLVQELDGRLESARRELEAALESSSVGEFDCISASALARVAAALGDDAARGAACRRVLAPYLPRPYCIVLSTRCKAVP